MTSRGSTPTIVCTCTWLPVICAVVIGMASLLLIVLSTTWQMGVFGVCVFTLMPIGLYVCLRRSYRRALFSMSYALETKGPSAVPLALMAGELSGTPEARRLQQAFADWDAAVHRQESEQLALGRQVKLAESETADLASTLSSFIYYTSHTLRTPLNAIRWIVEMFKNEELGRITKKQRAVLDKLEHSTVDLVRIAARLQDTLLVMRGDRLVMKKVVQDMRTVVDEAIGEWSTEARRKDLTIDWQFPDKPLMVSMDLERVGTAVRVLIENAVRYSLGPNDVRVHLSEGTLPTQQGNACAVFSITDRGIGIPEEERSRMFQPFFRGEKARLLWVDGTGINLTVTRSVARSLGGDVWFESTPTDGTTFFFALPLAR